MPVIYKHLRAQFTGQEFNVKGEGCRWQLISGEKIVFGVRKELKRFSKCISGIPICKILNTKTLDKILGISSKYLHNTLCIKKYIILFIQNTGVLSLSVRLSLSLSLSVVNNWVWDFKLFKRFVFLNDRLDYSDLLILQQALILNQPNHGVYFGHFLNSIKYKVKQNQV